MKTERTFAMSRLATALLAATLISSVLVGCSKKNDPDISASPPANAPRPAVESVLAAWEQGDSATAISRFLETDWSARPLFAPGSTLSLSEEQFKKLPSADRQRTSTEVQAQLATMRKLAGAGAQAGRDAAAKKDVALAGKHFAALGQFGSALDGPDSMLIVKLVGQALQKMADAETAKLPQ